MIEIKNIRKSFDDKEVLKGISTIFEAGKTSLIIGASGSGKTVFMKCMIGLLSPDSGDILYSGRSLAKINKNEKKQLRQEIGMLFQGSALFDSLTVEQNVMFPLEMFTEMTYSEKLERVNHVLQRVNLVNANHKFPSEISGGMMKRVGIARAIVMQPKYLFCDEPNSGLDPQTAITIDELISEITHEFGITTIVNTHDMNSVMSMGEKILFLWKGEKHWEGSNKEVLHSDDEELENFIFASDFLKQLKKGVVL
ncbi:MAG: ATP-binding cassette domain-containing protein [Sphingobacteriales bacterium]|nr:ATP-binding cassette domain-containing protein [Sphingobacteriales bacterium]